MEAAAAAEAEAKDLAAPAAKAGQRRTNRGALPAHLPRFEVVVEPQSLACSCCSGDLHRIGEDVAERIDIISAQIRVLVTRRSKYACRSAGRAPASWTTAASNSTPTPSRARSGPSCSTLRIASSPDQTAAANTGPSSPRFAGRDLQAEQRRAPSLPRRRAHPPGQRTSQQPPGSPAALGIGGLETPLTLQTS